MLERSCPGIDFLIATRKRSLRWWFQDAIHYFSCTVNCNDSTDTRFFSFPCWGRPSRPTFVVSSRMDQLTIFFYYNSGSNDHGSCVFSGRKMTTFAIIIINLHLYSDIRATRSMTTVKTSSK